MSSTPGADHGSTPAARRNAAGAPLDQACARKAEQRLDARQERGEVGPPSAAHREADLRRPRARRHPGQIAGCQAAVDETVQETRIQAYQRFELGLDADEKAPVAAEPETSCDGRARPVRAEHETGREVEAADLEAIAVAGGADEARAVADAGAGALRLVAEPAQQARGVGGEKEASRREQIDMPQVRRVEPHAVDAPRHRVRHVDFLGRLLDQDAGGGDARAGVVLRLQNHDRKPAHRRRPRRHEPGKARPDDQQVAAVPGPRHRVPLRAIRPGAYRSGTAARSVMIGLFPPRAIAIL